MAVERQGITAYNIVGHKLETLCQGFVDLADKNSTTSIEKSDARSTQRQVRAGEWDSSMFGRMSSAMVDGKRIIFRYGIQLEPPMGMIRYEGSDDLSDRICAATAEQWEALAIKNE